METPKLTPEQIKELALARLARTVIFSQDVPLNMLQMVFMPFVFMDQEQVAEIARLNAAGEIGEIYEYLSEAGPRSVNGLPSFMSFKLISKADLDAVIEMMDKLRAV
jgi:hypothetical protein